MTNTTRTSPTTRTRSVRDPYVDFLRAASLLVVVVWHWVFVVIRWEPDGPHFSNPIATTRGLWFLTWLLQVMPLFFFVGGYVHLRTWRALRAAGGGTAEFYGKRLSRLLVPAGGFLALMICIRILAGFVFPDVTWLTRGVIALVLPLWFLAVYVVLVLLAPLTIRLHERMGPVALVLLAAASAWIDLLRFHFGHPGVAWASFVVVWAACHQLGYLWDDLVRGGRQLQWSMAIGGFAALSALTNMGLYPRSMVGVPGDEFSNVGPPTLCILALMLFQAGVVLLVRPAVTRWLERPRPAQAAAWANANAMTVFLWHVTAFAIAYAAVVAIGIDVPETTNGAWWVQRPLWLVLPLVATVPLLLVFRPLERRGRRPA